MKKLYFLIVFFLFTLFVKAQIINFPDANFKAKLLQANASNQIASSETPIYNSVTNTWSVSSYNSVDTNGDGEIQLIEAQAVKYLYLYNSNISNISGVDSFTNLQYLNCAINSLSNLNISNLANLNGLTCFLNNLSSLDVSNLSNLKHLDIHSNEISGINLSNLSNLEYLNVENNELTSLNVSALVDLRKLYCYNNSLTSLNASGLTYLQELRCSNNQLTTLNVSNLNNLTSLITADNQLTILDTSALTSLQYLNCDNNQLNSLNLSNSNNLVYISCRYNQITNLNVSNLTNLINLLCSNNQLTNISVSSLSNLQSLWCDHNQLFSIDISNLHLLTTFYCDNNIGLNNINIKNGIFINNLTFSANPNLEYICVDENYFTWVQSKITQYGYTNCNVNSYCNFNPGGTFYNVQGNNRLDSNNNGCNVNDVNYPNLKFNIFNGSNNGTYISNPSGNYSISVSAGTHTFTPQLENPTYFNISPPTTSVTFPATASPFTQNFCITANGVRHDLEIVIIPISPARPGFDATYKLKYKNKGNQIENATLIFNYDDSVLDFISTSVTFSSQNTGVLNWNLGTLNPFQQGEILVILNLNSPMETPPLNSGNFLNYSATINGLSTDETPIDNTPILNQIVVNSYDPNDKRCLEGNTISPTMIGQYVHYMIRFENTGTFPAENIVVKDLIDLAKFDIATLQMTSSSHDCFTRIKNNTVEFIFENINLDFNDATNDGYVVFKIKTKSTLTVGSQITNNANIYFDYNFPIITNTETSTFQALNVNNFSFEKYFTIYPNPVKDILNITKKEYIEISSITIYNVLGQILQTITQPSTMIDVSNLKTGNYFIRVTTNNGTSSTKIIKE